MNQAHVELPNKQRGSNHVLPWVGLAVVAICHLACRSDTDRRRNGGGRSRATPVETSSPLETPSASVSSVSEAGPVRRFFQSRSTLVWPLPTVEQPRSGTFTLLNEAAGGEVISQVSLLAKPMASSDFAFANDLLKFYFTGSTISKVQLYGTSAWQLQLTDESNIQKTAAIDITLQDFPVFGLQTLNSVVTASDGARLEANIQFRQPGLTSVGGANIDHSLLDMVHR